MAPDRLPTRAMQRHDTAVIVSHGPCLDGAAAAVCVARAYGPANVTAHFTHPSDIDAVLRDLGLEHRPPADLWITDISWKDAGTERLLARLAEARWSVFWIDHHSNAIDRAARGLDDLRLAGHRITREYSAARLTYDYLIEHLPAGAAAAVRPFEPIVLLADDTDRWIHRLDGSRDLARAVGALTSEETYEDLLRTTSKDAYPPRLAHALAQSTAELAVSLELAEQTRLRREMPGGLTLVACVCDGYVSEVADHLRQGEGTAVFVIYNTRGRRISLRRSNDADVDCAVLAGGFGGGGHPAAAGFDLPELDALIVAEVMERTGRALGELLQRPRPASAS